MHRVSNIPRFFFFAPEQKKINPNRWAVKSFRFVRKPSRNISFG